MSPDAIPLILPRAPGPPLPVRRPTPLPVERPYIRPRYAEAFACIHSACEDTCCQGWSVPIDQRTWEKYRTNEVMKPHIGKLIVLNTTNPSTSDYARMPLTVTGTCAFLEPDRLCGVQKKLGPEMLSHTCATYPRALSTHAGQPESALNLSCPEAARLTLLNPNLLGDGPWRAAPASRYARFLETSTQSINQRTRLSATRLDVREFALLLLSDRSYPLWQRLSLLGTLTRRLQALAGTPDSSVGAWCDANPTALANLLSDSARAASTGRLRHIMNSLYAQPAEQLQIVIALLQQRLAQPPVPLRFIECLQQFERGIGVATHQQEDDLLADYARADRLYFRPFTRRHPQIIENYLVNHIFKNNYPFGQQLRTQGTRPEANVEDEHFALCVHAALAQTLLVGIAGHLRESFDSTHAVKLIQSLARTIEHSQTFLDQITAFVHTHNLNNSQGIATLLRLPSDDPSFFS